ncbi:hypothetical protein ONV78_22160 [Hahella sp. CR1]|uniref:hypothetical protein n=1 Tax=Hahella sp. CR1 TaxID=2992807 RepID=UPI0024429DD2|nr:hypothetical protein [Hahella sp. CR1]MDG9670459.1 hypothetical protein [Hahella sp. CR1]
MYNLDIYRHAVIACTEDALRKNLPENTPIGSIHILRGQVCYWPDLCLWVDANDQITELQIDPVRDDCALPPNMDEDDPVNDFLVKTFPDIPPHQFEFFSAGALMCKLWNTNLHVIEHAVYDFVQTAGYTTADDFVVLFEEAGDFSLRKKTMQDTHFYDDAIQRDITALFNSENSLREFAHACYRNEADRHWLMNFRLMNVR